MDKEPEQNQPEGPKGAGNAGIKILWFLFAFVPSLLTIPFAGNNASGFPIQGLAAIAIICCLFSGFGVSRGVKDPVGRAFLALFLAGLFFVLNVFIVILVGCSGMGRIAP